jgi:Dolichyl-phosphate-mannose-protein mannosyltransferase
MSVVEAAPRRRAIRAPVAWPLALTGLFAVALGLRLWGIRSGLPFVYNADENNHFVPRAIGMFGHGLNPNYFVNPPAFTYVVHFLLGLRWGFSREAIGNAYAVDPTAAFVIGRAASATIGALAALLTAVAGARLIDRRTGAVAGALAAVAFLAVAYGHLALNDDPAMAPVALSLVGVAGVYKTGRRREFAIAGIGLGLACATKYTAGIVLVPLLAAAWLGPGARLRGLLLAGALALAAFVVANPYAVLDPRAFHGGLVTQSSAAGGDSGSKLGLASRPAIAYYLGTLPWGLGWLPAVASLGGAVLACLRDRRLAAVLVPAPLLFLVFMATQSRFFARWMLPIYPLLCLLAAYAAVRAAAWLARRRAWWPAAVAGALLCAQSLVVAVENDRVLSRTDTRQLARDWMVANVPAGSRVVVEPVVPDQWASDPGHPSPATDSGVRWIKWVTANNTGGKAVKLEDYERTLRPGLLRSYRLGGYCWVVTGSTQYGRAYAAPRQVPDALRYYAALRRQARVVYRVSPYGSAAVPFSFDASFLYYPSAYERPGPEMVIYRLDGCAPRS